MVGIVLDIEVDESKEPAKKEAVEQSAAIHQRVRLEHKCTSHKDEGSNEELGSVTLALIQVAACEAQMLLCIGAWV